jgi:spore coat polysaccharide biosynthesis protein SpsF
MMVAAIVQARMGSTRLPGKVLRALGRRTALGQLVHRLRACHLIDRVVIATTDRDADDAIAAEAARLAIDCFRGSEEDVLSRYAGAAAASRADAIVRITADCPLIDPEVVDAVIDRLQAAGCEYASNTIRRTFPRGLDAEAFTRPALERLDALATGPGPGREHVTWLVHHRPGVFTCSSVEDTADNSDLRWTVDTEDDWRLVERLYRELALDERLVPYRGILAHVRANPGLARINAHVDQKA